MAGPAGKLVRAAQERHARGDRSLSLPDWYLPIPEIPDEDRWYLDAFYALSTCRQIGMTAGPIPWTAIVAYADRNHLTGELADTFVDLIGTLDRSKLALIDEDRPKPTPRGQPPAKPRKARIGE